MKKMSRREFLKAAGATTIATAALSAPTVWVKNAAAQKKEYMGSLWKPSPQQDKLWKQYSGETVYILTENTPPSVGIRGAASDFTALTGMKAEFTLEPMDPLTEKVFLDLRSGAPKYHVNYGQPQTIGNVVCEYWQPLNKFFDVKTGISKFPDLPDVPDVPFGMHAAFMPNHVEQGSMFYDEGIWYAMPYDTAMGVIFFRTDLVEKYGKKFEDKYGKSFKPGGEYDYEHLLEMGKFINENCKEVDKGLGFHMAQYWAINQDYVTFLTAWGVKKEGFAHINNWSLGSRMPGPYLDDPKDFEKAVSVVDYMRRLSEVMHPDSRIWDWGGLGTAHATGKIAIQSNCGEFCPYVEDPKESVIAGKVGYAVQPRGPAGIHAYEVGASGLGIPAALPWKEQRKALIFVLWATGPAAQWKAFTEYYGTPVRTTAYEEARKKGWLEEDSTFRKAQHLRIQDIQMRKHLDGFGMGPKIPTYTKYIDITGGELNKWISGEYKKPEEVLKVMQTRMNRLHGV